MVKLDAVTDASLTVAIHHEGLQLVVDASNCFSVTVAFIIIWAIALKLNGFHKTDLWS